MPARPKPKSGVSECAERIANLREILKINQTRFAWLLETKPSAVSKWEAGKSRPRPPVFVKLARLASGKEKDWFLEQAGIAPPFFASGAQARPVSFMDLDANTIRSLDSETLYRILEAASGELAKRNRSKASRQGRTGELRK